MTHGTLQYIPSIILPQIEQYQSATSTYSFKTFHNSYNLPLSFESLIETLKNFNPIATFTTALYSFSTIAAICVILWISVMMYPFFKLITSHLLLYPIYKILPPHMNTTSSKERKNI
uniref:Uncharacterized protein n=1 Tax=Heterorhabditis bacteriophora TaxID=37862 RepID=A0A1I7WX26_HETBA